MSKQLNIFVDSLDEIPEQAREFYIEDEAGGFRLNTPQKVVGKQTIDEFRQKNTDLLKQMKAFEGIDPEEYRKLKKEKETNVIKNKLTEDEVEQLVSKRVSEISAERDALAKERDEVIGRHHNSILENTILSVATKAGVTAAALEDAKLRFKYDGFAVEGDQVVQKKDGQVVYGRDGVTPVTADEWMGKMTKAATHWFAPNQGGDASGSKVTTAMGGQSKSGVDAIASGLQKLK